MASKIVDLLNTGVITGVSFGTFTIKTSVVVYDYARCFIAKRNGELFAFLEIENSDALYGWNVAKVSLDDINDVNCGEKPVQSLFIGKESYELLFGECPNSGFLLPVSEFREEYSIRGEMYVSGFCDMDAAFDYHGFAAEAIRQNSNKISIVLQNKEGCNAGSFFKIVNYIKDICKKLSHPLNVMDSTLTVVHASTVVTFTFNDNDGGIFANESRLPPSSSAAVAELANILGASDSSLLLSNQKNTLKKYDKLLEEFKKTKDLQPKIVIASPDRPAPVSYQMSKGKTEKKKRAVEEAISFLDKEFRTVENLDTVEGELTGIITINGNYFGFKTISGRIISGNVDFQVVGNESFDVGGAIYSARIKTIRVLSPNNNIAVKESHVLVGLEFLRKIERFEQAALFE